MTKVIHLEKGAEPPEGASCLTVARDVTGGFFVSSSDTSDATPSDYPVSENDRTAAIERASAHADRFKIPTVYVVA